MAVDRRSILLTCGGTATTACIAGGWKLAFNDMVIPFRWAMLLLVLGLLLGAVTALYAFLPEKKAAKASPHQLKPPEQIVTASHGGIAVNHNGRGDINIASPVRPDANQDLRDKLAQEQLWEELSQSRSRRDFHAAVNRYTDLTWSVDDEIRLQGSRRTDRD